MLKQLAQLVEAVLPVSFLISVTLGREHQFPQRGQAVMLLSKQSRLHVLRKAWASCCVPAKHCLGGDLIHILTARARRTKGIYSQILCINLYFNIFYLWQDIDKCKRSMSHVFG